MTTPDILGLLVLFLILIAFAGDVFISIRRDLK